MAWQKPTGWKSELIYKNKLPVPCIANIVTILAKSPKWKGVLVYDAFASVVRTVKEPPWTGDDRPARVELGEWSDTDTSRLMSWLARRYKLVCNSARMVDEAIVIAAQRNIVHPVRDYLDALVWDKQRRLDTWLVRLAGADDSPYTRAVGSRFLISAVARAFVPGAKVDHVLIFEGSQGLGKSTMLRSIVPNPEWFCETNLELGSKDSYQIITARWIVVLDELDSLTRSALSRVKNFITATADTFRASYGRLPKTIQRACVFAGTTDGHHYLKDDAGARRFWPVRLGPKLKIRSLERERDQLWAEAVVRYRAGDKWHFTEAELREEAARIAEDRRQIDPWEPMIQRYLRENKKRVEKNGVTTTALLAALNVPADRMGRADEMRVGTILRRFGWAPIRGTDGIRRYRPTRDPQPLKREVRRIERDEKEARRLAEYHESLRSQGE